MIDCAKLFRRWPFAYRIPGWAQTSPPCHSAVYGPSIDFCGGWRMVDSGQFPSSHWQPDRRAVCRLAAFGTQGAGLHRRVAICDQTVGRHDGAVPGRQPRRLSIAWKITPPRGWRSEAKVHKTKRELIDAGFRYETRKGRRPNFCALFTLTWCILDDGKKFDPGANAGFVSREYLLTAPLMPSCRENGGTVPASPAVSCKAQ
jgi:hypothetical protein